MITLTRLNKQEFLLNPFLFEQAEALPDTTITLTTGKKIVVTETLGELQMKIADFLKQFPLITLTNAHEGVSMCLKAED